MADCFYDGGQHAFDTDHRRSTLASGFKRMTRIDIHDNDFSSMYTAKSGTPLIHKMQGTPDELSDLTMSITPRLRTTVPLNSLQQEDSNHLREDSSVFCDKYNMRQCLKYLDQEMSSSGLQSLFNDDSDTVDIVQFVNNAFILVKERQNNRRLHSDYCETQKKLESDIDQLSQLNNRLKEDLEESERSRARLDLTVQQLRATIRDLSDKLKTEKDEVRRLDCVMHSRETQYKHESRKKEQELEKMKERMHRLLSDKVNKKVTGIQMTSSVDKVSWNDTDWYRSLVGSFEEREKVLVDENCGLREGLMNVQQELLAILTTNATHAISDEQDIEHAEEQKPKNSDYVAEAYYEMPYTVVREDLLANLKEKCQQIKEIVAKGGKPDDLEQVERLKYFKDDLEQVERLKWKLQEYELIIEQHRQLLLQTIHSADDTADMSFLTDTSHLDEKDDTKTKEALFQRQRMQLEEEHHKLVEYAAELAKQRRAVEQMRLEVLHKEFMLLTPFRSSKTRQSDAAVSSPTNETAQQATLAKNLIFATTVQRKTFENRSVSERSTATPTERRGDEILPTTAELFRHLGIVTVADNRGFMSATRSAIHLGLNGYHSPHDGSPGPQGSCHGDDAAMALDDVKTMLFSKPDDKDMAVQEELIAQ